MMRRCIAIRYEDSPHPHEVRIAWLLDGRPWWRCFVRSHGTPLRATGDALLCFGLLPALELGCDLSIEAPVDRGLLSSSAAVQRLVGSWTPGCSPITVTAPATDTDYAACRGHGCFFSGGVDSSYSLAVNKHVLDGLVTLIGCDVDVTDRGRAAWLAGIAHGAGSTYGLEPIIVETDLPRQMHPYLGWIEYHGSALAGFRHLLADRFATMRIAASVDSSSMWDVPWGSHPGIDPQLGTGGAAIMLDGTVPRPEKIVRLLDEPALLEDLRVCYHGGRNCGTCKKCVLTRVYLAVLGGGRRIPSFPPEMPALSDAALRIPDISVRTDMVILRAAALGGAGFNPLVARIDRELAEFDRRRGSLLERLRQRLKLKERIRRGRHRQRLARFSWVRERL